MYQLECNHSLSYHQLTLNIVLIGIQNQADTAPDLITDRLNQAGVDIFYLPHFGLSLVFLVVQ